MLKILLFSLLLLFISYFSRVIRLQKYKTRRIVIEKNNLLKMFFIIIYYNNDVAGDIYGYKSLKDIIENQIKDIQFLFIYLFVFVFFFLAISILLLNKI